jgi:hypothetical protein
MSKKPEIVVEELLQKIKGHRQRIKEGDVDYLFSEKALYYVNPYPLKVLAPRLRNAAKALKER